MLASLSPSSSSLSPASSLPLSSLASPPLTPSQPSNDSRRTSPSGSDDSALFELSFVYEENSQGEYVRFSKRESSPPTPLDRSPVVLKPPSPVAPPRPSPLSRSESMPSVEPTPAPRSFQRVASGPVLTPASSSARASFAPLSTGAARKLGGARRVKVDEFQQSDPLLRSQTQPGDEKENLRTRASAAATAAPFAVRPLRTLPKKSGIEKIVEERSVEEADDPLDGPSRVSNRPRRSASLSDASGAGYHDEQPPYSYQRPGTSMGARRVTIEEKMRKEREIALIEGYAMREAEEAAEVERRVRQSPSPTHVSSQSRHQRRDSDTLRSLANPLPSPTAVEHLVPRTSPPIRGAYPPVRHRRSPTAPEPPTTSEAITPGPIAVVGRTWAAGDGREREREREHEEAYGDAVARARSLPAMSVPAPAPAPAPAASPLSTTSVTAKPQAKSHAHPPTAQVVTPAPDVRSRNMVVNKKAYARLDLIGKGGSSRVYRVMNGTNEIYAIKRVALDKTDAETMSGYMNEIALLKRLEGNSRIIRLMDSELRPGPGGSKGHLLLVMECGEIDLARLLQEQQKERLDLVWISYYWKQMLQAVHVIHEEKIVHSDLKPANFVLVRGQLKLIDFGIANAIANDTTNIQRDHQIGTVNYMSPEAIELPDGMRRLKVGRPSDVWSLGCILYQMVYGHPPFQHLSVYQKMKAIPDESRPIQFPEYATPSVPGRDASPRRLDHLSVRVPDNVIETMRSCLVRNPKQRATIPELLDQDWLVMRTQHPPTPPPLPTPPALKEDETIINPHFMKQLLQYGMLLGKQDRKMDDEALLRDADRLIRELQSVNQQGGP
ncbi:predicted protein [Sparassis crispa]|uniref:Protein kinase domain-containing protein n=1 Tax=Sparassis crispa TaxID=139825 RepID=A0A401GRP2_9APHY|nr:predicted protein [Sparassis crispa]GBE84902.1 predicted protein [Sparassis crispa]